MSLKDRIEHQTKALKELRKDLKQAREEKWDAEYVRRNDERREGESDEHWHKRRKRNRVRAEHKDEAVDLLAKKLKHWEKELDDLREHRQEYRDEQAEQRSSYEKGSTKIVMFDGRPLVEDLAFWLEKARKKGGWNGVLVSGYRSPAYSQQLCYLGDLRSPVLPGQMCRYLKQSHQDLLSRPRCRHQRLRQRRASPRQGWRTLLERSTA